jgi:hypothetical protein
MSIQQCYETFFTNNLTNENMLNDEKQRTNVVNATIGDYRIYSSLIKHGYILRRSKCSLMHEPSIKLSAQSGTHSCTQPKIIRETIIDSKKDHGNLTIDSIYSRLNNLIPNINLIELKAKLRKNIAFNHRLSSSEFNLLYDIYLPNKNFRKSQPGVPTCKLITQTVDGQKRSLVPRLSDLILNNDESNDERASLTSPKHIYSFICNDGDILFYSFAFNQSIPCVYENFNSSEKK